MTLFDPDNLWIVPTAEPRPSRAPSRLDGLRPAELFDAWLFAEADATLALASWFAAPQTEKPDRHAAYLAALERESHAADVLQGRLHTPRRTG